MELNITNDILLYQALTEFYNTDKNIEKLNEILYSNKISLRIIDWFVTNYSKKNYTILQFKDKNGNSKRFKVYQDYKLRLKAYSKKRFDPFCRWERINLPYKDGTFIQTTLGQLNFFRWALENKVIDYIRMPDNIDFIKSSLDSYEIWIYADFNKKLFFKNNKLHHIQSIKE